MSEIRMFSLESKTKFSSDFRHSGRSVRSIVWLYYKRPKYKCSVGRVDQPNVWNPNCLGMGQLWKAPKSESSDFRRLLYLSCFTHRDSKALINQSSKIKLNCSNQHFQMLHYSGCPKSRLSSAIGCMKSVQKPDANCIMQPLLHARLDHFT